MKEKTYAGKIKNTAAQYVKALFETEKKKTGKNAVPFCQEGFGRPAVPLFSAGCNGGLRRHVPK